MSANHLISHSGVESFFHAVSPFLLQNEAEYGLILGLLEPLRAEPGGSARLMLHAESSPGNVSFVAFCRDIYLVVTHGSKDQLEATAIKMRDLGIKVPGVVGPPIEAETFAASWSRLSQCGSLLAMDQGIYKLVEVKWPEDVPGKLRLADEKDLPLVSQWRYEFFQEAAPHDGFTREAINERAEMIIRECGTFFWEHDGKAVAMASLVRSTATGITVGAVYTPPDLRRHGYATALSAAVSAEGLKRGKSFCMLYTDLLNPASNAIYQKIGYRRIGDSRLYRFSYDSDHS